MNFVGLGPVACIMKDSATRIRQTENNQQTYPLEACRNLTRAVPTSGKDTSGLYRTSAQKDAFDF